MSPCPPSERTGGSDPITPRLRVLLEHLDRDEAVEVVAELTPTPIDDDAGSDRRGRIDARRRAFERRAAEVALLVERTGGEVRDRAWINDSLRLTAPAAALSEIAAIDVVAVLDLPHAIEPDRGEA